MGNAQPYSGTDGQRVCMRPHHKYAQDHGVPFSLSPAKSDIVAYLVEYCIHDALQHHKMFACDAH